MRKSGSIATCTGIDQPREQHAKEPVAAAEAQLGERVAAIELIDERDE